MNRIRLFSIINIFFCLALNGQERNDRHGWPEQKAPQKLIVCSQPQNLPESMLLESLSGLAAQAVNEGTYDTMVWINISNESYRHIYQQTLRVLGIASPIQMDVWELLTELKKKKVIKGYVLYKEDKSKGQAYSRRKGMDISSNVGTVYASLNKGVLIEQSLREKAEKHGLKCLKDARNETLEECFSRNKSLLNNHSALSVDPLVSNCRDFAIAQKLMLYYDTGAYFRMGSSPISYSGMELRRRGRVYGRHHPVGALQYSFQLVFQPMRYCLSLRQSRTCPHQGEGCKGNRFL